MAATVWAGQMLRDRRARLDAGERGGPPPDHKDLVAMNLAQDRRRRRVRREARGAQAGRRPALGRGARGGEGPADRGTGAGGRAAGSYTLEAIYREVGSKLPLWRREALDGLHDRLDHGELEGENPNPLYQGDRAELALRFAELEARIEDFKQLGVQDAKGTRWPWREPSDEQRLDRIVWGRSASST